MWELFWTFLMIGFVSVGGGFSMVPVIEHEAVARGWMNAHDFSDMMAIAGASPGPTATNCAIMVGYHAFGIAGAATAAAGMMLPSLMFVVVIGLLFAKYHRSKTVESAFYGLRPIVTALVFYAAIRFVLSDGAERLLDLRTAGFLVIFAGAFVALTRYNMHPLAVIAVSGLAGAALYA